MEFAFILPVAIVEFVLTVAVSLTAEPLTSPTDALTMFAVALFVSSIAAVRVLDASVPAVVIVELPPVLAAIVNSETEARVTEADKLSTSASLIVLILRFVVVAFIFPDVTEEFVVTEALSLSPDALANEILACITFDIALFVPATFILTVLAVRVLPEFNVILELPATLELSCNAPKLITPRVADT